MQCCAAEFRAATTEIQKPAAPVAMIHAALPPATERAAGGADGMPGRHEACGPCVPAVAILYVTDPRR